MYVILYLTCGPAPGKPCVSTRDCLVKIGAPGPPSPWKKHCGPESCDPTWAYKPLQSPCDPCESLQPSKVQLLPSPPEKRTQASTLPSATSVPATCCSSPPPNAALVVQGLDHAVAELRLEFLRDASLLHLSRE